MTRGIRCPNCGHSIEVPTILSNWVRRDDENEGCQIVGINENEERIYFQRWTRGVFSTRYEAEEDVVVGFDNFRSEYRLAG
jgi:hypothetical protein